MSNRILIVDNDDGFRYATARLLTTAGFDVVQARDFRDALPVIEDGNPLALLVVDLMLPSVNGFALARMGRMKQFDLKVVYVTDDDDIPGDEAIGPIMHKPVEFIGLLAMIRDMLNVA
jgi:DNA-binding response OmpR family regulator